MNIITKIGEYNQKAEVYALPFFADDLAALLKMDSLLGGFLKEIVKRESLAESGKFRMIPVKETEYNYLFLYCLGEKKKITTEAIRCFAGSVVQAAKGVKAATIVVHPFSFETKTLLPEAIGFALGEGLRLGDYSYLKFKQKEREKQKQIETITLLVQNEGEAASFMRGIKKAHIISDSVNLVRDLVNDPANIITPNYLANVAKESVKGTKAACTILGSDVIKKEKLVLIEAVCQGSKHEPKLIVLEYKNGKGNPLVLVGKGVCFDSGGLQIKPGAAMQDMKMDMAGAATVIGVVRAIARLQLPVNVIGIAPCVENMPSGTAYRPGDIFVTPSGKTVEIGHTDAEGRLILADGLYYAQRFKPKQMIDIATLTGACIVALGSAAAGVMSTDETIVSQLKKAGEETHERVWELPLYDDYFDDIKSDVADIKNIGSPTGDGGAITAAMFLKEFTNKIPWAHLDIAGTAMIKKGNSYVPKGATGNPVRLLVKYIENREK